MCPPRRLSRALLSTLAFATVLAAAAPGRGAEGAPTESSTRISATDLLKIQQVAAPEISPDGKSVVYTVKSVAEKGGTPGDYTYRTQLWLAPLDGSAPPRALTHGDQPATSPQWSPDGRTIAFVRGESGKQQLWLLPFADGGEAVQLTKLEQSVASPRWSPDGTKIAFTMAVTTSEVGGALETTTGTRSHPTWDIERPGRKPGDTSDWSARTKDGRKLAAPPIAHADGTLAERRDWLARNEADANPRVTTRLNFLGENDLQPDVKFTNLFVIDAREGAKPVALAPDYESLGTPPGGLPDGGGSAPAWSRDSKWLFVTGRLTSGQREHPDRLQTNDLIRVSVDGKSREALRVLPEHAKTSPIVSPDGRSVAFLTSELAKEGYAQTGIGIWTDGQPPRLLETQLDRSASQLKWSADGAELWFVAPSQGDFVLYRSPASGGRAVPFSAPRTGITSYDVSRERVVYARTAIENPSELFVSALARHEPRRLSTHNTEWLRGKQLAQMEHRVVQRPDGFTIDAWLMKPADFEPAKKYPLLLQIHGGPSAMWGPGEASMWHEFQFFATRGYAIVFCNPRGSGGYGYDFQRANFQNWGPGPAGDVLAAVDVACREPWVDAGRIVITGGSYGGYLTAWIISQDQRFKAAVAQRGVYDLTTFFGEGNAWRLVPRHFGGYPWEPATRKILDANSPFVHVESIRTPLLIQHGDVDFRTGVIQSQMLYKALKVLGRPVEYARYPRATHELSRSGDPKQRVDTIVRYEEFFRRFIGSEADRAAPRRTD